MAYAHVPFRAPAIEVQCFQDHHGFIATGREAD